MWIVETKKKQQTKTNTQQINFNYKLNLNCFFCCLLFISFVFAFVFVFFGGSFVSEFAAFCSIFFCSSTLLFCCELIYETKTRSVHGGDSILWSVRIDWIFWYSLVLNEECEKSGTQIRIGFCLFFTLLLLHRFFVQCFLCLLLFLV